MHDRDSDCRIIVPFHNPRTYSYGYWIVHYNYILSYHKVAITLTHFFIFYKNYLDARKIHLSFVFPSFNATLNPQFWFCKKWNIFCIVFQIMYLYIYTELYRYRIYKSISSIWTGMVDLLYNKLIISIKLNIAGNLFCWNCNKKLFGKYNTQFDVGQHKNMKHSVAIPLYYIEL